jgi:predicted amidohydrolase
MRLALAQCHVEAGALEHNVERALRAVRSAAADGADLVALPELFSVGYFAFDSYPQSAEPLDGPTLRRIGDAASEHGIAVLAGSVVEDLAASRATVYDPWGTKLAGAGDQSRLVVTDVDPDRVAECRAEFPALGDRRE